MISTVTLHTEIIKLAKKRNWYYKDYEKNINFFYGSTLKYVRFSLQELRYTEGLTPIQILKFIRERIFENISGTGVSDIRIYLSDVNDLNKYPNAILTEPFLIL